MGNSTLSVIMPNYNYAHYIGEALEAILSQSFKPCEVIVVDDGSTDNSIPVIEQFAMRDAIVRILRNEHNMGLVFTINRGLKHASGNYIYLASSDDKVLPGFFEKSMKLLTQYPQAGLCCSGYNVLKEPDGVIQENKVLLSNKPHFFSSIELVKLMQKRMFPLAGQTIIMKRSAFIEVGGFDPKLGWKCDWFVDFVVGFRYGICYIPENLAIARLHPNCNSMLQNKQSLIQLSNLRHILYLLRSNQYCDVLPSFQRTGILSCFKFQVLIKLFLREVQYSDFLTPLLVHRVLWLKALSALNPITPLFVKDIYNRIYYRHYIKHQQ